LANVTADLAAVDRGMHPAVAHRSLDGPLGEHPERERQLLRGAEAHGLHQRVDAAREPADDLQRPERGREKVLVRVARREDQAGQAVGMVRRHELAQGATRVVAHQRDVLEAERLGEVGDELREPRRGEIGVRRHGLTVRAERQVGNDATKAILQARDDLAPQRAVDQ
jgi:hypothetical protein